MAGRLTAGQLAQVQKATAKVIPVVRISWAEAGHTYYTTAGCPASSTRYGPISPQVESWDDITYALPDYRGGLEGIQTSFTLSDLSRTLVAPGAARTIDTLVSGRYSRFVDKTSVLIFLISEDASTPDILLFSGLIVDAVRISTFKWKFICRTNDSALMSGGFKIPLIDQSSYPSMVDGAGKFMPLPFGWFDTNNGMTVGSITGALKAYNTGLSDGTGGFPYRYLASVNWLVSVKLVCVGGIPISNTTWVRTYGERRGLPVTEIWLANDPAGKPITYDGFGIGQNVGSGSVYNASLGTGAPIRNPTRQMQFLLLNHVLGSYRPSRAWWGITLPIGLGDSGTLLDTTTWNASAAFDDQRYFSGCIPPVESLSESPATLFAEWCRAWGKRPYWTPEGTLALALDRWDVDPATLTGARHIRYVRTGTEDSFAPVQRARNERVNRISSASWVIPASGEKRTVSSIGTGEVFGSNVDEFHNRFTECVAELDPTVLPAAVTRAYFVDCATAFGNAALGSGASLSQLGDYHFAGTTALGTAGVTPPLFMTADDPACPAARPYMKFDVANSRRIYGQAGDSWGAVATAAAHTVWVVVSVQNATLNAAAPNSNHPIITESSGGYFGIYVKNVAGKYYIIHACFDTGIVATPDVEISLNTWYIVRARHYSGKIFLSIDNWTEVSANCGNLGNTAGIITIGGDNDARTGSPVYSDISVAAVVISSNGNQTAQGNDTSPDFPALHDNYRMWAQLRDRYVI